MIGHHSINVNMFIIAFNNRALLVFMLLWPIFFNSTIVAADNTRAQISIFFSGIYISSYFSYLISMCISFLRYPIRIKNKPLKQV